MISIVISVFNEEKIIPELLERLEKTLSNLGDYEIVFVDDGSKDKTADLIIDAHITNNKIKLVQFSRNFGQVCAIRAGLHSASGDIVVLMDGDLQDRPEELPKLISKIGEGYDVAYAKRLNRHDPLYRKLGSKIFVAFMGLIVPRNELPEGYDLMFAGIFRAMRKEVVEAFNLLPERTAHIQSLLHWVGFSHTTVDVEHGERASGKSRWTLMKLLRYALDAIISFSPYPLRKVSILGVLIAGGSFILMIGYVIQRLFFGTQAIGFTTIVLIVLFMGGLQLFLFGVIGEYLGRMYIETKSRPLYIVKKKLL
jgi:polyisoprenyl-phosphate glycosyltransferase